MAGRGNMKPVPTRDATRGLGQKDPQRRTATKRRRNAILLGEALELASTYDITVSKGNAVVDVLQTVLDRLMDKWRWVCKKVDMLDEDEWLVQRVDENGNRLVEPNVWIQYEQTLRAELIDLGIRMGHLGVDERRVRVQEAQVELLGRAVLAAAHAIGLPLDTQKQLGAALRDELIKLEDPTGAPNPAVRQGIPGRANDKHPVIDASATAQEVA
jgi:hypothetical protein